MIEIPEHLAGRILAFLPTYNESGNIESLIDSLLALDSRLDVLVVDDKSPDGTGNLVARKAADDRRIHLVSRDPPRGRGLAGREGFRWFQNHPLFSAVVEMDADFSHHPRFIPALLAKLSDFDAVVGSRFTPGGRETGRSVLRRCTSMLANTYLRFVLQTRLGDCTSGFRAFTRKALAGIDFQAYVSEGPTIVTELVFDLLSRKRKIGEVPIIFENRRWGDSKLSPAVLLRSFWFPLWMRYKRLKCWRRHPNP